MWNHFSFFSIFGAHLFGRWKDADSARRKLLISPSFRLALTHQKADQIHGKIHSHMGLCHHPPIIAFKIMDHRFLGTTSPQQRPQTRGSPRLPIHPTPWPWPTLSTFVSSLRNWQEAGKYIANQGRWLCHVRARATIVETQLVCTYQWHFDGC